MIQIAVCPGKPKDLISFLKPLFDEVEQMYKNQLVIKKQGAEVFRGRVTIVGVTGDIPGITELMGSVGHTGTYGCRAWSNGHIQHGQVLSSFGRITHN